MEWFVLFQPEYKVPHIFNLHERGMFQERPTVSNEIGVRLIATEKLEIQAEARYLREQFVADPKTGRRFYYVAVNVTVPLTQKLTLHKKALAGVGEETVKQAITEVFKDWLDNHLPRRKDGKVDRAGLKAVVAKAGKKGQAVLPRSS